LEACKPSPASIGGGGENQAYPKGESIQSILWRMRFVPQVTLDSYLPELAAESLFLQLVDSSKERINFPWLPFSAALKSPD
jgi:hypothetical protein